MTELDKQLKEHTAPAWGERADIMLQLRIASGDPEFDVANPRYEQIWSRHLGEDNYEVCCIPFFIYNLSLGDVVKVVMIDDHPRIQAVTTRSGHHTFRAWFGKAFFPVVREQVVGDITAIPDCLFEWHGANLLAIDADGDETANRMAHLLEACESRGQLRYETGRT